MPAKSTVTRWIQIAWLSTATAMLGSACANMPPPNLISPTVQLADFNIADIGLSEIRFDVLVHADNPNDIAIPMSQVKVDLDLFGSAFASGVATQPNITIPARGAADVPLHLVVPTSRVLDAIGKARRASDWSQFSYRLKGSANWGNSAWTIPFTREGNLDVIRKALEIFAPGATP